MKIFDPNTNQNDLHSSMERLKEAELETLEAEETDLHSSMERLKARSSAAFSRSFSEFTFQYGEIKSYNIHVMPP